MARGILSGMVAGGVTGAVVLCVLSLYAPMTSPVTRSDGEAIEADPDAGGAEPVTELAPSDQPAEAPVEVAEVESVPDETAIELPDNSGSNAAESDIVLDETALNETAPEDTTLNDTSPVVVEAEAPTRVQPQDEVAPVELADTTPETSITTEQPIGLAQPQSPATEDVVVEEAPQGEPEPAPTFLAQAPLVAENQSTSGETQLALPDSDVGNEDVTTDRQVAALRVEDEEELPVAELDAPDDLEVPQAEAIAPVAPAPSEAPQVATVTRNAISSITAPDGITLPQSDDVPTASVQTAERPEPAATRADEVRTAPTPVSSDTPITLNLPQIGNPVEGGAGTSSRLPTVTDPVEDEPSTEATPETDEVVVTPDASDVGALTAYAAQLEGEVTGDLFSIILVDDGTATVPRSELMELDIPFSIALDPASPNAGQVGQQYRSAGIEVLALVNDLPASATPSDVAVAVEGYFGVLSEAIAIMDPLDARIQSNRSLLQPVLGAIRDSGHALVTYDQGLNSAQQAAQREGIAAATVFRVLDEENEEAPRIKRYLDRAAFNASRDGSVVVLGRARPETVRAILEWALDEKGSDIDLVPVSYVMLQSQG